MLLDLKRTTFCQLTAEWSGVKFKDETEVRPVGVGRHSNRGRAERTSREPAACLPNRFPGSIGKGYLTLWTSIRALAFNSAKIDQQTGLTSVSSLNLTTDHSAVS